jgi:hypothetical protein
MIEIGSSHCVTSGSCIAKYSYLYSSLGLFTRVCIAVSSPTRCRADVRERVTLAEPRRCERLHERVSESHRFAPRTPVTESPRQRAATRSHLRLERSSRARNSDVPDFTLLLEPHFAGSSGERSGRNRIYRILPEPDLM